MRGMRAGGEVMLRLLEHPGIHHRGAANHDALHVRLRPADLHIHPAGDVAIANDRNFHRIRHLANDFPIRKTGVALRPRATMHRDGLHAAVFENAGHGNGIDEIRVPADAHLGRHRNRHRFGDLARHAGQQRAVFEQGGAAVFGNHLVHRAAEIDVDEVGLLPVDDFARGFAHAHAV